MRRLLASTRRSWAPRMALGTAAFGFSTFCFAAVRPRALPFAMADDAPVVDIPLTRFSVARAAKEVLASVVQLSGNEQTMFGWFAIHKSGSGFCFHKDLQRTYILTNAHVVDGQTEVIVSIPSRDEPSEWVGRVLGCDRENDIAVIVVEGDNALQPAKLGESAQLQLGEFVIAAGSPLGLESSVSLGVVSNKAKLAVDVDYFDDDDDDDDDDMRKGADFIQIDAAVNQGSSGGPIATLDGRVVGVARLKAAGEGLAFAIPIERAMESAERIRKRGPTKPVYAGIKGIDMWGRAIIVTVQPRSPAHAAGLREGDAILRVNGKRVHSMGDVTDALRYSNGERLDLTIQRGKTKMHLYLTPIPTSDKQR